MTLRKLLEEEDYYCLVQCDCGRKFKPDEMFLCYFCNKIKCHFCLITEAGIFQCKGFCNDDLSSSKKGKITCDKCLECPLCFTPLIKKLFNRKYYLFCTSCYWTSQNIHISKEKKEDFDTYITYLNQEKNSGFFKGMYDNILTRLNKDNFFAGKIEKDKDTLNEEMLKFDNEFNTVQKAMEKSEQNFEEFDKKIKEELINNEKQYSEKYEYNDDYLNIEENKENKNTNFKLKSKLLSCYNDYNQNYNTLDEAKKALNSNALSINIITSLEQRHNNVVFQNNTMWNTYPKFIDLIPKKRDYSKQCKECGNFIVKIPETPTSNDEGIMHSYISLLPIILINKIDWEKGFITLKFILVNFMNLTISFNEDPLNQTKIVLPEGKFEVEDDDGDKKRLIDFKFDEKYKGDFVKNNMYIFRFILITEFKRSDAGDLSCIQFPVEIKFK